MFSKASLLILIGIVFLAGCTGQAPTGKLTGIEEESESCIPNWQCGEWGTCERIGKTTGTQERTCTDLNNCTTSIGKPLEAFQNCEMPPTATIEPSKMIIELSDFPEGRNFTLKERVDRFKSDLDPKAVSFGWERGYQVVYWKLDDKLIENTRVDQLISIYPLENVSKILELPKTSTTLIVIDYLPNPNIGEGSKAYRVSLKEFYESAPYSVHYVIEFYKLDVYETITLSGTVTDYELLKDLARKSESKIV